jgi:hypothetical protein
MISYFEDSLLYGTNFDGILNEKYCYCEYSVVEFCIGVSCDIQIQFIVFNHTLVKILL